MDVEQQEKLIETYAENQVRLSLLENEIKRLINQQVENHSRITELARTMASVKFTLYGAAFAFIIHELGLLGFLKVVA